MIAEKSELDAKLKRLGYFMRSRIKQLPPNEWSELVRQSRVMREYSEILGSRIKNFGPIDWSYPSKLVTRSGHDIRDCGRLPLHGSSSEQTHWALHFDEDGHPSLDFYYENGIYHVSRNNRSQYDIIQK
jgi:hypothetical protein